MKDQKDKADLKHKISEFAQAEDRGVSLLTRMREFVPEDARDFLESQIVDEKKHNQLFQERADELNAAEVFLMGNLKKLYELGDRCVAEKDWLLCMTCQSVIEELALASFGMVYSRADERTRAILKEIMEDEKRHLDFTLEQIKKILDESNPENRDSQIKKIAALQNEILNLFLAELKSDQSPREHKADLLKNLQQTYRLHKTRFKSIGLETPKI